MIHTRYIKRLVIVRNVYDYEKRRLQILTERRHEENDVTRRPINIRATPILRNISLYHKILLFRERSKMIATLTMWCTLITITLPRRWRLQLLTYNDLRNVILGDMHVTFQARTLILSRRLSKRRPSMVHGEQSRALIFATESSHRILS